MLDFTMQIIPWVMSQKKFNFSHLNSVVFTFSALITVFYNSGNKTFSLEDCILQAHYRNTDRTTNLLIFSNVHHVHTWRR